MDRGTQRGTPLEVVLKRCGASWQKKKKKKACNRRQAGKQKRQAASAACKFPARVQELDGALYLVGGDNGISWARLRKRVGRARLALLIEMDQGTSWLALLMASSLASILMMNGRLAASCLWGCLRRMMHLMRSLSRRGLLATDVGSSLSDTGTGSAEPTVC